MAQKHETIEAAWLSFAAHMKYDKKCSPHELSERRLMFFSGAFSTLLQVFDALNKNSDQTHSRLTALASECTSVCMSYTTKEAPPEPTAPDFSKMN